MNEIVNRTLYLECYSGISGDMDGQVKFIYRTEAIKAEDTKKEQED